MTSTQHVRVVGTSYQRGRQYGRQAAARVRLSVQAYQRTFAHWTARTLDDLGPLLADHADYPHSICAHPDPADHPCEQDATIASMLMDLTVKHIWLAAGDPCQASCEQLDIAL